MTVPYFGSNEDIYKPNRFSTWGAMDNQEHYVKAIENDMFDNVIWDKSWGYKFNSFGFRSEEVDVNTDTTIFTIGCSYTFGEGIPFEDTWSQCFKNNYVEKFNETANMLNFSLSGGSNDYITRMILTQLSDTKPDLLLCQFTFIDRAEDLDGEKIEMFGTWITTDRAKAYFAIYNKKFGMIHTFKNILLVQNYCKINNIPYIFTIAELSWFDEDLLDDEEIKFYYDLIDEEYLFNDCISSNRIDRARDGYHPGRASNKQFGDNIFNFYCELKEDGKL